MLIARRAWRGKRQAPEATQTGKRRAPDAARPALLKQRGDHLLEALIAIALLSVGVLGLAGVLASSIRFTDEARLRSEAAQLAHALIAQMWTTPAADLDAQFAAGGAAFDVWRARVVQLLPAATAAVELGKAGLSAGSRSMTVSITWLLPGSAERHRYVTSAEIGRNP